MWGVYLDLDACFRQWQEAARVSGDAQVGTGDPWGRAGPRRRPLAPVRKSIRALPSRVSCGVRRQAQRAALLGVALLLALWK